MPFYPGPGLGGHCIPIDPLYLTWKAREYSISTRFIELAGEINTSMPEYIVARLAEVLDARLAKGLNGARILIIGAAYKKNIGDMRESPSLVLIDLLRARNAAVDCHDPYVPVMPFTRAHPHLAGMASVPCTEESPGSYDVVLISIDHDCVDYQAIVRCAKLVVDTRNATHGLSDGNVVKA